MNRTPPRFPATLDPRERVLLAALLLGVLAACLGPALPDPMAGTGFADGRGWRGLPHAMDVLSNLPFAVLGVWGLLRLRRLDGASAGTAAVRRCARLFFVGLVLTAFGSAFYHLHPDALRLTADRLGMAVAFAGMVGLAVSERIGRRVAWPVACGMLVAGLLALAACHLRGNVLPWAVLQFGGMALVLGLALLRPVPGALGLKLGAVICCYGVAKLLELGDDAIYQATGQLVSGHSLKHLAAACAGWPALQMLRALRPPAPAAQSTRSRLAGLRGPNGTFE
ncbi:MULTISPECIES: hypothetical protein [unclassified Variovorax]|uniref:hypothetical protein n=1 Tax=unclassified Variovorax TaxID=663243 RepID=UPI0025778A7F|nr:MULTISPECIES: hypothetical protein [unclassified Variovorax]MDM0089711.1 hypothetical protein [Variovorax sp. J22G40]MDM0148623.1 hypothetical protein [Variovorax sp. J2P1-31]